MNLVREATVYLRRCERAWSWQWPSLRRSGPELARRLSNEAANLGSSKATRFSPEIPTLHLLAAKVALLALGPDAPELATYERDLLYYKSFNYRATPRQVADYDAFKAGLFLRRYEQARPRQRPALRRSGQELARQIAGHASTLGTSKATECSPEIPRLSLLAAKVALLALGPDSPDLPAYECHVLYYKNSSSPEQVALVTDYEAFKAGVRNQ